MTPTKTPAPQGVARTSRPSYVTTMLAFILFVALVHLNFGRPAFLSLSDLTRPYSAPSTSTSSTSAAEAPSSATAVALKQDVPPTSLTVIHDSDIAAAARRSRRLPACAASKMRARSFLIVFMGHSGSSAILSELREHPQIHVEQMELVDHQEVFDTAAALSATRAFFKRGHALRKLPGFKIRPAHILANPSGFRSLLTEFDTRIIWQYRQNVFKASVGEYSTRYLNDSSAVEGLLRNLSKSDRCSEGAGCSFPIDDVAYLHSIMTSKVRSHHFISKAVEIVGRGKGCVREVPYEDYLYDRVATMRDIQQFLGVPYAETEPQRFKATGDNMCSVVENWDEVCSALYGCITWQPMLDDARNMCFCSYSGGPVSYCDAHSLTD